MARLEVIASPHRVNRSARDIAERIVDTRKSLDSPLLSVDTCPEWAGGLRTWAHWFAGKEHSTCARHSRGAANQAVTLSAAIRVPSIREGHEGRLLLASVIDAIPDGFPCVQPMLVLIREPLPPLIICMTGSRQPYLSANSWR